jgi:Ferric reductase like transmembrane component
MVAAAAAGPSAFWYLTRGTGAISMILLTLSVALGVMNVRRVRTDAIPRFVLDAVHRNASLLALAFLLVHIVTSLLDGFAPIALVDVIVPFTSSYRPLWLGLGALAFDLLVAVTITSLVRRRLGYRSWRAVHWAAYAAWPFALLHGLGTGSDTKAGWMLAITAGCVIVVIVAVVARATAGWPDHLGTRSAAILASAITPIGLLVWLPSGPLAAGWAKRSGTPASLLAATSTGSTSGTPPRSSSTTPAPSSPSSSFSAQANGAVHQTQTSSGLQQVDITLSIPGQALNALEIKIVGPPLAGGGVQMSSSAVTLGPSSDRRRYHGQVTALQGTNIDASVHDGSGARITVLAQLQIDPNSGNASGTVTARAGGG